MPAGGDAVDREALLIELAGLTPRNGEHLWVIGKDTIEITVPSVHDAPERHKKLFPMDVADEMINVTSRSFLALTVGCARCHDHKYDPLSQKEFYALFPNGPLKISTKIAGVPKPKSCI